LKLQETQKNLNRLADLSWELQQSLITPTKKKLKRPPVYLFLSPESKGSLKGRSKEEIAFVHEQQRRGGGACLRRRPMAYVSKIEQGVEESAHLFALIYKKEGHSDFVHDEEELGNAILHEAYARFIHGMFFGSYRRPTKRGTYPGRKLTASKIWQFAHREGYFLGEALCHGLLEEKISIIKIRSWFWQNWRSSDMPLSLRNLYRITTVPSFF